MTKVIAAAARFAYVPCMRSTFAVIALSLLASPLLAHCDWIKGPVVADARVALAKGDVTPVLKWISAAQEPEVRDAFARALEVRKTNDDARALADRWFFETVVRLHRATEGEPYTGLRGDDYTPDAAIERADEAIERGSLEEVQNAIAHGLHERFAEVMEAKKHAGESAENGRKFVHAYAEFIHFVLRAEGAHE